VIDKNEMFASSYGWLEIGVLFSTAYAQSVCYSPAHMHNDACVTNQFVAAVVKSRKFIYRKPRKNAKTCFTYKANQKTNNNIY